MKNVFLAIVVVCALVVAGISGTLAVFSDAEEVGQNVFTAGTLDLKVNGQDNPIESFTCSNMKPGDVIYAPFNLKNTGTLNGILAIRILNRVNLENGLEEPEIDAGDIGEPGELGAQCRLKIWHDTIKNGVYDPGEYTWPDWPFGSTMLLNDVPLGVNLFAAYTMVAGSEHLIIFRLQFKDLGSTNNLAMGDSVEFDIEFRLEQTP